jgi:hypothetical protein
MRILYVTVAVKAAVAVNLKVNPLFRPNKLPTTDDLAALIVIPAVTVSAGIVNVKTAELIKLEPFALIFSYKFNVIA